jgi:hypothetical protein
MYTPVYSIQKSTKGYQIELCLERGNPLLTSKPFSSLAGAQDLLQQIRLHVNIQTNFNRKTYEDGAFGFEVRTCWDDLLAVSQRYYTRKDREDAMIRTLELSRKAQFVVSEKAVLAA